MPLFASSGQTLMLNVKDYGATGNGTNDDAAAIQATINLLPATGGTVYLPAGNYKLTASLTVPATILTGFRLTGAGWDAVLTLANGVNDYAVKCLEGASGL